MTPNISEASPFSAEQAKLLALAGWTSLVHHLDYPNGTAGWAVEASKGDTCIAAYADTPHRAAGLVARLVEEQERAVVA